MEREAKKRDFIAKVFGEGIGAIFGDVTRLDGPVAVDLMRGNLDVVRITTPLLWACGFSCTSISPLNPSARANRAAGLKRTASDPKNAAGAAGAAVLDSGGPGGAATASTWVPRPPSAFLCRSAVLHVEHLFGGLLILVCGLVSAMLLCPAGVQMFAGPNQEGNWKFVSSHRPPCVINENVQALDFVNKEQGGSMLQGLLQQYALIGYAATSFRISPLQLGIPQSRNRIYILALDKPLAWPLQHSLFAVFGVYCPVVPGVASKVWQLHTVFIHV